MLSPRCCFYVAVASPGIGAALIALGVACVFCVVRVGLIASKPAPTRDRCADRNPVGAGLLAMGCEAAPKT
jgi:hypothetical protein